MAESHSTGDPKWYRKTTLVGRKSVSLHRLRAEKALGRPLPDGAQVHHVDGTKSELSPLVICQDQAFHKLLHVRERILRAGGNPNTDAMCAKCRIPKPLHAFAKNSRTHNGVCVTCRACRSVERNRGLSNRDKMHCKHGHAFTAENTYIYKKGGRGCRACHREQARRLHSRKTQANLFTDETRSS